MSEVAALWSHAGCNPCRVQPLPGATPAGCNPCRVQPLPGATPAGRNP
ncbi:hypothetical protein [Acidithiobacillus ferrooxidans]|nr:hypothetical protein [Acidithiobacillus ferrooxidans]MCR1355696.1 hypothetical protein [Acidithiobacillus ferrooxidans]